MNTNVLHKISLLKFIKAMISTSFGVVSANVISTIIDNAIKGRTEYILNSSFKFLILIALYEVSILILNIVTERVSEIRCQKFRVGIYDKFLNKAPYEVSDLKAGSLIQSFSDDILEIIRLYRSRIPDVISNFIMVSVYLVFIGMNDFKIGLILITIGMVQLIPPIIVKRFMEQNYDENIKLEGELTDYIIEGFNGMATIKLFNLKEHYLKGLETIHKRYFKIGSKSEATAQGQNTMENATTVILKFGTYGLVGWFVTKSYLTLVLATKVVVLAGGLYGAMNTIFIAIPKIAVANKARSRVLDLVGEVKEEEGTKKFSIEGERTGGSSSNKNTLIEVENLGFSYKDKEVLKRVSFKINAGDKVIIQGANGSGKSTLFKLLLGFYREYSGDIFIGEKNLRDIGPEEYFKTIGVLMQEDNGFSISPMKFLENLSEGGVLNLEDAVDLSRKLGIKDEALYNDKIEDMSGGEKKKLYLIASLLKESQIMFLDEPGNSLDIKGKEILRDKLLSSNKTIILITHDPFFEEIASVKIKLNEGRSINIDRYLDNRSNTATVWFVGGERV